MKVAFVHLGKENLGIEYLSAVLKKAGHQTFLASDPGVFSREDNVFYIPILERLFNKKKKIIEAIGRNKPDVVAFSVYTSTYQWAADIARTIKKEFNFKTVFGGIHATLVPEKVMQNDFVDFVIVGEGEFALLDLVEKLSNKSNDFNIDNVWFKKNKKVYKNKLRELIPDIDTLPFLDKELFEKEVRYIDDYATMASRGCLFNCSYCCESAINRIYNRTCFRRRSIDSVMKELNYMKSRYDFREVMFWDSIFFTDKDWLTAFLPRFKKEINVPFRCFGHVNFFNEKIGRMLKEGGCYCIDFGVQTLNEQLRKSILNRYETNDQIKNVFDLCDKLKLKYDVDIIFGLPGESMDDYILAIEQTKGRKSLNRIKSYNLTYFPKTRIEKVGFQMGILTKKDLEGIEDGIIGDFFHRSMPENKKIKKSFKVFYKILPLLPIVLVNFIMKKRIYKIFFLIPSPLVIFFQMVNALIKKDYRFIIYPKNYIFQFKKRLVQSID